MAALNFPSSPSNGDTYTANGITYVWNGTAWKKNTPSSTVSGITTASGVVNIANDLDVDGHTNLDNVSIAGVTTFTEDVYLRDDKYIYLGNDTPGNDAKIYFDEYNFILQNSNTSGQTYVRGTTTRLDAGDTSSLSLIHI